MSFIIIILIAIITLGILIIPAIIEYKNEKNK